MGDLLTSFSGTNPIRVLVVDDSALVRSLLTGMINAQKDMVCVGAAHDPLIAREMIRVLNPDVLTLDIEMPRMDGLAFLERLMRLRPTPVIMISTLTERGADVTLKALELGAVDFVSKPRLGIADGLAELQAQIVEKIRIAASVNVKRCVPAAEAMLYPDPQPTPAIAAAHASLASVAESTMIFIGASTGGPEAIREVLLGLPAQSPAVLITQHMPPGFTHSFAKRLDSLCRMTVQEAVHGERIRPGHVYIAPGGRQFRVQRCGAHFETVVEEGELVNRHKPSVEVLFQSAARELGRQAIGVMLTGMGSDGARAMRELKDVGGYNLVQNERSCVVFGMPRSAILHGAAHEVLPVSDIAPAILARLSLTVRDVVGAS